MINISNIAERIREIIEDESVQGLKEELKSYHEADLADIFQELKPEERLQCFKCLDEEKAADLLEFLTPQLQVEILGDIDDEYDVVETDITEVSKDEYIIDGLADIDQVEDILEAKLPVEDYDTLSGFILGQLGRFPEEDEKVSIEYGQYQFEVLEYSDRVITTVKVTRLPDKTEENYDNSELSEY